MCDACAERLNTHFRLVKQNLLLQSRWTVDGISPKADIFNVTLSPSMCVFYSRGHQVRYFWNSNRQLSDRLKNAHSRGEVLEEQAKHLNRWLDQTEDKLRRTQPNSAEVMHDQPVSTIQAQDVIDSQVAWNSYVEEFKVRISIARMIDYDGIK